MAAKLKNLKITSTDLVDQGANPDACIKLFKRKDDFEENTIIKKFINAVINLIRKEEPDTMKIDKSKMTEDEQRIFNDFEKRYSVEEEHSIKDAKPIETDFKVKKILDEFEKFKKAKDTEIEELRKNLEIEKLTAMAKKYEIIGKNPNEIANKLYELKKANVMVYNDYLALLDENLSTVEKSGLFTEIGKNTSGSAEIAKKIEMSAAEIQKRAAGINIHSAIVKAWEDNPELAIEYEREYMGGMK